MKEIIPFNKADIKEDIQEKFSSAGYDVTSEGNNMSILIDLLSYAASIVNTNTAFGLSDITLTNATQRKNILSLARQMGYEARNRISYQYKIYLRPTKPTTLPSTVVIPRYSEFTDGILTYYYMQNDLNLDVTAADFDVDGVWVNPPIEIVVKEGLLTRYYDAQAHPLGNENLVKVIEIDANSGLENYLDIPYLDVEEDGVEVFIKEYNVEGTAIKVEWEKRKDYIVEKSELDGLFEKKFLKFKNIRFNTERIYFKFAGLGNDLIEGTQVFINILQSSGVDGIATDKIIGNIDNWEVLPGLQSSIPYITGTEEESNDSVKLNAPLFYNSGNRLVTSIDYEGFLEKEPLVKNSFVWGGEDEPVQQLGHVWYSLLKQSKPMTFENLGGNYYEYDRLHMNDSESFLLLDSDISDITTRLNNLKIMTIRLHNRQPMFIDYYYEIDIAQYNSITKSYVHTEFFNIIKEYFDTDMEDFQKRYFQSTLIRKLDNVLGNDSGFDITVTNKIKFYQAQIVKETAQTDKFIINLNVPYNREYFQTSGSYLVIPDFLPYISKDAWKTFTLDTITDTSYVYVDFTVVDDGTMVRSQDIIEFPIYLRIPDTGTVEAPIEHKVQIGTYYLINTVDEKYIRIEILVDGTNVLETDFVTPVDFDIDMKTTNWNNSKTTISRLSKVKFL